MLLEDGSVEGGAGGGGGAPDCPAWVGVADLTALGAGLQTSPNEGGGKTSMLAGALEGAAAALIGGVAAWDAGGGTYINRSVWDSAERCRA